MFFRLKFEHFWWCFQPHLSTCPIHCFTNLPVSNLIYAETSASSTQNQKVTWLDVQLMVFYLGRRQTTLEWHPSVQESPQGTTFSISDLINLGESKGFWSPVCIPKSQSRTWKWFHLRIDLGRNQPIHINTPWLEDERQKMKWMIMQVLPE